MKVKRLPRDPGPAGWNAILPPAPPPRRLRHARTADWLIVGAGFAGLSAARRFAQRRPGDDIVVLDAVRLGEGPAGRNSGFMIDLPHDLASENYGGGLNADRAQIAANRAAIDFADAAAREYRMPEEAFRRTGKINAAASPRSEAHNRAFSRHLTALGEAHETVDAEAMRTLTGSDYYHSGLYTPGAAMIQPAIYIGGLAAGLGAGGVAIYEESPVVALRRRRGVWCAETPEGAVEAPRVILAVNGHADSFGYFERRLIHVFTYASMTRALSDDEVKALGGAPDWSVTPAEPMGTTVRRISGVGGARIMIRNRFTFAPTKEVSARRLAKIVDDHDRSFAARFPTLRGVDMEYRWGGRLCLSRNDAPAFGEVDENLFAACCQNGLGVAKGTFSGIAAADVAAGEDTFFARFMQQAPRPARLPPSPLMRIGVPATLRWKEAKAGRDL